MRNRQLHLETCELAFCIWLVHLSTVSSSSFARTWAVRYSAGLARHDCRKSNLHGLSKQAIHQPGWPQEHSGGLDMLNDCQLILLFMTVAMHVAAAPSKKRSVGQDKCKSMIRRWDLLHAFQLILHCMTVATELFMAPGNN